MADCFLGKFSPLSTKYAQVGQTVHQTMFKYSILHFRYKNICIEHNFLILKCFNISYRAPPEEPPHMSVGSGHLSWTPGLLKPSALIPTVLALRRCGPQNAGSVQQCHCRCSKNIYLSIFFKWETQDCNGLSELTWPRNDSLLESCTQEKMRTGKFSFSTSNIPSAAAPWGLDSFNKSERCFTMNLWETVP